MPTEMVSFFTSHRLHDMENISVFKGSVFAKKESTGIQRGTIELSLAGTYMGLQNAHTDPSSGCVSRDVHLRPMISPR